MAEGYISLLGRCLHSLLLTEATMHHPPPCPRVELVLQRAHAVDVFVRRIEILSFKQRFRPPGRRKVTFTSFHQYLGSPSSSNRAQSSACRRLTSAEPWPKLPMYISTWSHPLQISKGDFTPVDNISRGLLKCARCSLFLIRPPRWRRPT